MPGQPCLVCSRPDRAEIELALLRHDGGFRSLAERFGNISHAALRRHLVNHLGVTVSQSVRLHHMLDADNLLDTLRNLDGQTWEMLSEARQQGDIRTALAAVRESRGNAVAYFHFTEEPLRQRIRDLEQQVAMKDALLAAAQLALQVQQSTITSPLPTPAPESIRFILKQLIAGGAAIGPEDIDASDDYDSPPLESEARNGTDGA